MARLVIYVRVYMFPDWQPQQEGKAVRGSLDNEKEIGWE
jgi:hypothetical protein